MKEKDHNISCLVKESLFCKKASNIVIKILRLSLQSAKALLKTIPDLKIIHLLRDPRAVLNSRVKLTSWYKGFLTSPANVDTDIQVRVFVSMQTYEWVHDVLFIFFCIEPQYKSCSLF